MKKYKGINYMHNREGDIVKIEIRDNTYSTIYKKRFNINDKNSVFEVITAIEKFSGFSVVDIIKEKLSVNQWF